MKGTFHLVLFAASVLALVAMLPIPPATAVAAAPVAEEDLSFVEIAPEDVAELAGRVRMSWQLGSGRRRFDGALADPELLAERPPEPPPPLAYEPQADAPALSAVPPRYDGFAPPRARRRHAAASAVAPPAPAKRKVRDPWLLSTDNFQSLKERP